MNVLYVDADQLGEVLREIIAQLQGITIDGRFLPAEVHPTADYTFADEQGLVELVQRYDGAVLDWTTFGHGAIRGGKDSCLPRYLQAIQDSGYRRPLAVTTVFGHSDVQDVVQQISPQALVYEKPFNLQELFQALKQGR
ncbi:MAG TPA: hypothetical protein VJI15_03200 [Candidatus Nanoarchaeia archaeon]|nr:hypothetical protein [Candidatus Nanoarchaeia archaeon]